MCQHEYELMDMVPYQMGGSQLAELKAAEFINMNVIHIFSADHQRAAQVLAKNLHAERGETAENKNN